MQAGYKEREERIAELEEFINDQVTELDKMEAAMKQTVHNKEIAEKELNVRMSYYTLFIIDIVGSTEEEASRVDCSTSCL